MIFDPLRPPPLLTADLPGVGGRIKAVPEDFEVEEIPAYPASGQGDFLYLAEWLRAGGLGAESFVPARSRAVSTFPSAKSAPPASRTVMPSRGRWYRSPLVPQKTGSRSWTATG